MIKESDEELEEDIENDWFFIKFNKEPE